MYTHIYIQRRRGETLQSPVPREEDHVDGSAIMHVFRAGWRHEIYESEYTENRHWAFFELQVVRVLFPFRWERRLWAYYHFICDHCVMDTFAYITKDKQQSHVPRGQQHSELRHGVSREASRYIIMWLKKYILVCVDRIRINFRSELNFYGELLSSYFVNVTCSS